MNVKPSTPVTFTPEIDWLTLATYNFPKYTESVAAIRRQYPGTWKHAKWLQYEGFKHQEYPVFYGHALQSNDREHYILRVSGTFASEFWRLFERYGYADHWYCTRIDLQRTMDIPEWWKVRELHDALAGEGFNVSIIQSATGNTLYLGARTSDRFTRFYEKDLLKPMLRLEIELKGRYSRLAYQLLLEGATIADIYAENLRALKLPENMERDYLPDDANDVEWTLAERIVTIEKKLEWLQTLIPTFAKLANDHDIGSQVRDIFHSLSLQRIDTDSGQGVE